MVTVFCSACGARLAQCPPTTCARCAANVWNDAKPCASALVSKDSSVLLVRRARDPWKGKWDVPGGFCDEGEHPILTAEREVWEETGIQVRVIGFLGIWLDTYPDGHGTAKRTLNIFYNSQVLDATAVTLEEAEITAAQFFEISALPPDIAFPDHLPFALEAWKRAADAGRLTTPLHDQPRRLA